MIVDRVEPALERVSGRTQRLTRLSASLRGLAKPSLSGWLDRVVSAALRMRAVETHRLSTEELLERTDAFNLAAESYFADFPDTDFLLRKPFSSPEYPRHLFNLGVLFHWGRVAPGDTVADFGAGSCWVSHFLNLYGCRTIAIDVSTTALGLGRELFRQHAWTRWDLDPQFLAYDGHSIPLDDAVCDHVVVHDAFHHVPNQERILRELYRVTKEGGIVAMCEPGRHHSCTENSRREMEMTGVLENDIVVEELAELACSCGFRHVSIVPLSLQGAVEVPAAHFPSFLAGRSLHRHWPHQARTLLDGHFILIHKGTFQPTSRRREGLCATIRLLNGGRVHAMAGARLELPVRVRNDGEALWLGEENGVPGVTRVGAHLKEADGTFVDYDWYRLSLPREMRPGEEEQLILDCRAPLVPGRYVVELDMVSEGVAWFSQLGSATARVMLEVRAGK